MSFDQLLATLVSTFRYVESADQRVYWQYLAGALVIAAVVLLAQRRRGPVALARALFPKRIWLHRSTFLDVKLLLVKPFVRLVLVTPWIFTAQALAIAIVGWLDAWRGVPEASTLSPMTVRVLYTITLFVGWDFGRFVVHRLAHAVPALWELHKVHHSAEVMTPLTIYRSHPIESLLFQLRGVVVSGLITGVFFHFFRSKAFQYEVLGVNALGFALNTLGGNLRHSHVWLRYPRWLEHVFISPAQHQLHHSAVLSQAHTNCGSWLAIWDWAFGSLQTSEVGRPTRFGLPAHEQNHKPDGVVSALVDPLLAAARRLRGRAAPVAPPGE